MTIGSHTNCILHNSFYIIHTNYNLNSSPFSCTVYNQYNHTQQLFTNTQLFIFLCVLRSNPPFFYSNYLFLVHFSSTRDNVCVCAWSLSWVQIFVTPCTVCSLPGSCPWVLQSRILEWVAMLFSRVIFPTQGSNPGFPRCGQILYHLSHQGSSNCMFKNTKYVVNLHFP